MLEDSSFETEHVCFALPDTISSSTPEEFYQNESVAEVTLIENQARADGRRNDLLSGLTTRSVEGLSRIVATMMCGEESAVHVFQKEAKRVEDVHAAAASSSLLAQIAAEETEHERLLGLLRSCLPISDDLDTLRRRARFFFLRIASRDPAIHFARIVGLDSGVCITLSCMLDASAALSKAPNAYRIWSSIWRDEARHVRISRQHVMNLGLERAQLIEEGRQMRKNYAERLVLPIADAFESIEVDPDKLLRRIVGPEEV